MRASTEFKVDSNEAYFTHVTQDGSFMAEESLYGLRVCRYCLEEIEEETTGELRTKYYSVDPDDSWESQCDWCGDTGWSELFEICETGIDKAMKKYQEKGELQEKKEIMPAYDIAATNALWSNASIAEDIDDDVSSINLKKEESFVHMQDEHTYNPLVTADSLEVNQVVYDGSTNHRLRVIDVKDGNNSWTKTITWKDLEDNRIFTTNPGVNALFELKVEGDKEFEVDDDIDFEFHPIDTYFENFTEDMDSVTNEEIRLDVVNNAINALHDMGYDDDFIGDYVHIEVKDTEDGRIKVEVRGEFNYEELSELSDRLNKVVSKYDKYAYFDAEDSGIASAYILKDQSDYVVSEEVVKAFAELIDACKTKEDLKKVYIEHIRPSVEDDVINTATLDEILNIFDKKLDALVDDETKLDESKSINEDASDDNINNENTLSSKDYTVQSIANKLKNAGFEKSHKEQRIVPSRNPNVRQGRYKNVYTDGFRLYLMKYNSGPDRIKVSNEGKKNNLQDMMDYLSSLGYEVENSDIIIPNQNEITESKSIKESDETTPYSKEEVERELKSFTHSFTDKEGELKCGFKEEKNLGVEILKQHYKVVEVSGDDRREGTWYHISFAKPKLNEELEKTGEDVWSDEVYDILDDVFTKMAKISYEVRNTVRGVYVGGDTVEDLVDALKDIKDMLDDAIDELEDNAERINESTLNVSKKLNTSTKTFSQWFDETQRYDSDEFYPFSNYVKTFESAEVLKDATAMDIVKNAHKFYDVYPVDSSDREKAFLFASKELGIKYDDLYDAWLSDTPVKLDKYESINESRGNDEVKNMTNIELAKKIADATEWNEADILELVKRAGLEDEYEAADGDTFESVIYKAAEVLGVEI